MESEKIENQKRKVQSKGDFENVNIHEEKDVDMEEELFVPEKRYSAGDLGKLEALHDIESIVAEVTKFEKKTLAEEKKAESFSKAIKEELEEDKEHKKLRDNIKFLQTSNQDMQSVALKGKRTNALPNIYLPEHGGEVSKERHSGVIVKRQDKFPRPSTNDTKEAYSYIDTVDKLTAREDEDWRKDLKRLSQVKSQSGNKTELRADDAYVLKYKEPIWPHHQLLHKTLGNLPNLTCLVLDGSALRWIRDIGSNIQSLVSLSVSNCSLTTLDGVAAFPNLRNLIACCNRLTHPVQCSSLLQLCHLDLSDNPITDLESFKHLILCHKLKSIVLYDTPASRLNGFSKTLKRMLPHLREILPWTQTENPKLKVCTDEGGTTGALTHLSTFTSGSSSDPEGMLKEMICKDMMLNADELQAQLRQIPSSSADLSSSTDQRDSEEPITSGFESTVSDTDRLFTADSDFSVKKGSTSENDFDSDTANMLEEAIGKTKLDERRKCFNGSDETHAFFPKKQVKIGIYSSAISSSTEKASTTESESREDLNESSKFGMSSKTKLDNLLNRISKRK